MCIYPQFRYRLSGPLKAKEMGALELVVDLSGYGTSINGRPLPKGVPIRLDDGNILAPFTHG